MDYMTASTRYPIATREKDVVPILNDLPDCSGVVLRDPAYILDPRDVVAIPNPELAAKYWKDKTQALGRYAAGRIPYFTELTEDIVEAEASQASIAFRSAASLRQFTGISNDLRGMFGRVYAQYTGIPEKDTQLRGFPLFTPLGGQGRSPELHADNARLELHWSAALSTFSLCDGEIPDEIWLALNRVVQDEMSPEEHARNKQRLIDVVPTLSMAETSLGDVTITRGQLGRDFRKVKDRRGVSAHVSSHTIKENGQAAYIIVPVRPAVK